MLNSSYGVRHPNFTRSTPIKYWFPAKRIGWGWGLPITWQGWAVLVGYILAIYRVHQTFPVITMAAEFTGAVMVLTLVLVGICWLKGEPPGRSR